MTYRGTLSFSIFFGMGDEDTAKVLKNISIVYPINFFFRLTSA